MREDGSLAQGREGTVNTSAFVAAMNEATESVCRLAAANLAAAASVRELARARDAARAGERVSGYYQARAAWIAAGRRADLEAMVSAVTAEVPVIGGA
jgi:hypothetical protein